MQNVEVYLNSFCFFLVIRKFLQQHEEHRARLYEVEAPGGWTQRRNIWLNIQLGRYASEQVNGPFSLRAHCFLSWTYKKTKTVKKISTYISPHNY